MTLVEVLAGLALLATLLASLLVVRGRLARQSVRAQRRMEAIAAADALLVEWWKSPQTLPRRSSGQLKGPHPLQWRTAPILQAGARDVGVQVVRLEIVDPAAPAASLVSVDVCVPPTFAQSLEGLR